jgi:hypothetical protein
VPPPIWQAPPPPPRCRSQPPQPATAPNQTARRILGKRVLSCPRLLDKVRRHRLLDKRAAGHLVGGSTSRQVRASSTSDSPAMASHGLAPPPPRPARLRPWASSLELVSPGTWLLFLQGCDCFLFCIQGRDCFYFVYRDPIAFYLHTGTRLLFIFVSKAEMAHATREAYGSLMSAPPYWAYTEEEVGRLEAQVGSTKSPCTRLRMTTWHAKWDVEVGPSSDTNPEPTRDRSVTSSWPCI